LGSSAAAIVAGLRLAEALAGDSGPPDPQLLVLGAALEGHADNVAACLLGGLSIAWQDDGVPSAVRLDVDDAVSPVVFCAARPMATVVSRALLPELVEHRAASANAARAGLLAVALTGRPDLLLPATHDLIHQDFRRAAMPESMALVDELRATGVPAVISGAGPSVLALCSAAGAAELTQRTWAGWRVLPLSVDPLGARQIGRDVG